MSGILLGHCSDILILLTVKHITESLISPILNSDKAQRRSIRTIDAAIAFTHGEIRCTENIGTEMGLPDVVAGGFAQVANNVYGMYQAARRAVDSGYESSAPGYFRGRWETAGIVRGVQRQDDRRFYDESSWEGWEDYDFETGETGAGDEPDYRIVIVGQRNVNEGTESSGRNPELSFDPSDSGRGDSGVDSGINSNGVSDSGMLADRGSTGTGTGTGTGYEGGYEGGYDSGGYDSGGGSWGGGGGGGGGDNVNYEWY
ncbi:MAG: hypothetical protein IT342_07485 [Candidatus Melainabacteria bacterium]|nr:hypothetical protein [Candidatus Melainabacteria bacterium]